MNNCFLRV